MISLTDLQHRLGFTRNEAAVILFLSAGLIAGTVLRWLRPEAGEKAGIPPQAAYTSSDSEFTARSAAADADTLVRVSGRSRPKAKPALSPGSIDINSATGAALTGLPGIGEAYALRIIAYRQAHGRFGRIEDLMRVPGIGTKKFSVLRPFVTAR